MLPPLPFNFPLLLLSLAPLLPPLLLLQLLLLLLLRDQSLPSSLPSR